MGETAMASPKSLLHSCTTANRRSYFLHFAGCAHLMPLLIE
jgi:hypothetical protein